MKTKLITTIMITLFLASMLSMAFVAPVAATPDSSLVGLWHFDEGAETTAHDSSGVIPPNDGTISDVAMWTTDSKFGPYALDFDGDDYVYVADSDSLDITRATLKAWIKPSVSTQTAYARIIFKGTNIPYKPIYLLAYDVTGTKMRMGVWIDDVPKIAISTTSLTDTEKWYHIAGTYDGSEVRIYVDGVLEGFTSVPTDGDIDIGPQALGIGRNTEANLYGYKGIIDEVRIYDNALPASEIRLEYEMVDKTLSASEGELGDVVDVTIEAFNPSDDYDLVVEDTIPEGFHYIIGSFMVDGVSATPTIDGHVISYIIQEEGVHVIEFDVKVDEAKSWDDMTVCNEVTASLDGVSVGEDEEFFVIHPFEELQKGARPVLFSDNFEDGDAAGWTTVGTGGDWDVEYDSVFQSFVYSQEDTSWTSTTTYDTYWRSYGDTGWTDYIVEAKVKIVSGGFAPIAGIFFRVQGTDLTSGYYMFRIDARSGTGPGLIKSPNKILAGCHPGYPQFKVNPAVIGKIYTLKVEVSGNNIKCYLDGSLTFDFTDVSDPYLTGRIGVGTFNAHAHFDDVLVTGPLVPIKEKTNVQWAIEIEVTNPFSYTMTGAVITDRFGAEIELDDYDPLTPGVIDEYEMTQGVWSFTTSGKSKKVFLTWDIGDLDPGETARLIILVSTDMNPSGQQEYTTPGIYELNSGATLKFIDPVQDVQLSAYTDSIYVTVLPLEDP